MVNILMVFLGGGIGSALRYFLSVNLFSVGSGGFPWPTFIVNILGSLLLGFLMTFYERDLAASQQLILLSTTGFCGGFTTFSTFSYENYFLIKEGAIGLASIYIIASVLGGLAAAYLAYIATKP